MRTGCQTGGLSVSLSVSHTFCLSVGRSVGWLVVREVCARAYIRMIMCVDRQADCMHACIHRYKERKKQEKKSLQLSYSHQLVLLHD